MSQAVADSVIHLPTVVVSDAFRLRPDAVALASQDVKWWDAHPEARQFAGRKFSANRIKGVERLESPMVRSGMNSGLLGLEVARMLGADRVLLLGFDMHGTHYFGKHPAPLNETTKIRFGV